MQVCWSLAHAAAPSASAALPSTPSESDLPALPKLQGLELAPAEKAEIDDLDARLVRLHSENAEERREAVREILDVRSKMVAAILSRLDKLAARADREAMKRALALVREKTNRSGTSGESSGRGPDDTSSELLMQVVERARPKDLGWRELAELVALSRMLTQVGNIHAARGLIEIYSRFGEFMRVDVQNRLLDLRDGAVPALIEARRHRAEKIARWAERQLDRLGKGVPSEAIRTENFEVLADVLRAYGRTKDPDATRIIISYANSERYQLREAARQAIVMLGEVGVWQLRDAYETVVGKRPRRDWSWDRTARELFFEFDRLHTSKIHDLVKQGEQAQAEGRFDDMAKAYDAVLARSPQFDAAPKLATGYLWMAEKFAQSRPEAAETAILRVLRLATDPAQKKRAESLLTTIRAERHARDGLIDLYLLRQAVELDPSNRRAAELLAAGERGPIQAQTIRMRWLTSGAIALMAAVAILFILLRRKGPMVVVDDAKRSTGKEPSPADASASCSRTATPTDGGNESLSHDSTHNTPKLLEPTTASPVLEADVGSSTAMNQPALANDSPAIEANSANASAACHTADNSTEPPTALDQPLPKRRDPFEDL